MVIKFYIISTCTTNRDGFYTDLLNGIENEKGHWINL